jgi:hypothetical protein
MKMILSGLLAAAIAAVALAGAAQAQSYSKAVQQFCRADYKKLCGEYGLETSALRSCMDRNGNNLSRNCVRALVRDGQISQSEVNRRKR